MLKLSGPVSDIDSHTGSFIQTHAQAKVGNMKKTLYVLAYILAIILLAITGCSARLF
jgi:hypothetical protein